MTLPLVDFRDENDIEAAFLNDLSFCTLDPNHRTLAGDLYDVYKAWCARNGYQPQGSKAIATDWRRLELTPTKMKGGLAAYWGVALTTDAMQVAVAIDAKMKAGR